MKTLIGLAALVKNGMIVTLIFGITQKAISLNIRIGTLVPDSSALPDLSSSTQGMLIQRMTTLMRDSIATPAAGLQILNLDDYYIAIYSG